MTATASASVRPIPNLRWRIAGLLSLASALNYLDRQTLSVLASTIQNDLGLSDLDYAFVTSAFLFTYTAMYLISGQLTDRWGTRRVLGLSVGGWSVATLAHAAVHTATQLAGVRMVLGLFESANFPAGIRTVAEWFPMRERALAVGVFNAGASIGAAVAVPLISFLALAYGWRATFVVTGLLGLVWVVAWLWFYRLPEEHPRLSGVERSIVLDAQPESGVEAVKIPLLRLLRMPPTWACVAARVLIDPVTYFLIFWIPKYLQDAQGFDLKTLGYAAWAPYAALALGTIAGGALPHALTGRGWTLHRARFATMIFASLAIPLCYLLLTQASAPALALTLIAAIMFFHGLWSNITLPTELFPKSVQGTVTGLGGTLGGIAGIGSQIAIGWAVTTISYTPVFVAAGLTYALALIIVSLTIKRLGEPAF